MGQQRGKRKYRGPNQTQRVREQGVWSAQGQSQGVRAKKELGQHFLVDRAISARIVEAIALGEGATVVEIGPGMGAITGLLLQQYGDALHCLELDPEAVSFLETAYPDLGARLHRADCLRFDFTTLPRRELVLVGNLPYNISSQVLFMALDLRARVRECVFMLQREVAERVVSPPGSRTYGILSVLLQAYFHIEKVLTVPPGAFSPPPKVYSGVVRLVRNDVVVLPCDERLFFQVVKGTFNQRRKTLRNGIRARFGVEIGGTPYAQLRPEELGVEAFVQLTNLVASLLPNLEAVQGDEDGGQ